MKESTNFMIMICLASLIGIFYLAHKYYLHKEELKKPLFIYE